MMSFEQTQAGRDKHQEPHRAGQLNRLGGDTRHNQEQQQAERCV